MEIIPQSKTLPKTYAKTITKKLLYFKVFLTKKNSLKN